MKLPVFEPMLATTVAEPFDDPDWTFELKFDGVRTLLYWDGAAVRLVTRRGNDITVTYPELHGFTVDHPVVLDGEIVALDETGIPSFGLLQKRMHVASLRRATKKMVEVPASFVVFDILYDAADVTGEPIEARRSRLAQVDLPDPMIRSDVFEDGPAVWEFVIARNIEGMVAKRRGSIYRPGQRSSDWRKVPHRHSIRAVVGGFTSGTGGRSVTIGSLVLGLWDDDRLRWIGQVGSGFTDVELRSLRRGLEEMRIDRSPFAGGPDQIPGVTWVEPDLVAAVEFKEWTIDGKLRAPVWKGFTDDPAAGVTWESEGPGFEADGW